MRGVQCVKHSSISTPLAVTFEHSNPGTHGEHLKTQQRKVSITHLLLIRACNLCTLPHSTLQGLTKRQSR